MFRNMLRCLSSPRVDFGVKQWPRGSDLIELWQVYTAFQAGSVVRSALEGWELLTWGLDEHAELYFEVSVCCVPVPHIA